MFIVRFYLVFWKVSEKLIGFYRFQAVFKLVLEFAVNQQKPNTKNTIYFSYLV